MLFFRPLAISTICAWTAWGAEVSSIDIDRLQAEQHDQVERYLDKEIADSAQHRQKVWKRKFSSPAAYERSVDPMRKHLWDILGGKKYKISTPLNTREELISSNASYKAYRIWYDAFAGLRGYGILLVPHGKGPFPALVMIHGMMGTPEGVCGLDEKSDYHNRMGAKAAAAGYVVFAPLHINTQKKRSWLDRKAILVGQRLQALEQFKLIRIVDYLSTRGDVDPKRIGAYGISWGGRSAMNAAALDKRIAACAISGHFNDLIPKMVQPSPHYTAFIETQEDYAFYYGHFLYFTDADVASLICPRPLLVEQGKADRVVYHEMSKTAFDEVQTHYQKLGLPDRAEYVLFGGGHIMHGERARRFFPSGSLPALSSRKFPDLQSGFPLTALTEFEG